MFELGPTTSFYVVVLLWAARTIILAFICAFVAWLGIRVLDVLTPHIHQRDSIGKNPLSVGLFTAGFFILVGLVIHGTVTGPVIIGAGLLESLIDARRLGLIAISFVVSLLLGIALFRIIDKLTPKIPFGSIRENPIAVGTYVFGYLVFFGLIMHAALTTPL
ncbi:MAG TPA: hypothetical protein G4O12_05840 [Dehalococcoidia bacterium]|nr:hypothetical protein [Dehalococcoidia bacterium]